MTPGAFIAKWRAAELKERSAAQEHFIDLCRLLGEPTPAEADPGGEHYCFERGARKDTGGEGWADVWKRHCFAWEYKGRRANLDAAFDQLRQYALALENPPLLVVSDMARFRLRTNWTNSVSETHEFTLDDLADAAVRNTLKWAMSEPERLRPGESRQALTERAAAAFASLAQALRERGHAPRAVAHFVNRLVFCMFAEDVGLLPERMFTRMLEQARLRPEEFATMARALFGAMSAGGLVGFEPVERFNGGLFDDDAALPLRRSEIETALAAAALDWSEIDPSILGTLFERGLDPGKRSQLGAHYTDRDKIMQIVKPVIVRPWLAGWARAKAEIAAALEQAEAARSRSGRTRGRARAERRLRAFLEELRGFTVLDPACGSGNFLYLALHALKDVEHRVQLEAEAMGLQRAFPAVGPANVRGIELNAYAAELARVSVWVGEIQWMRRNGFRESRDPILNPLDTIECRDALLAPGGGKPGSGEPEGGEPKGRESDWPAADVVIGNPPFLGGKLLNAHLGEDYVSRLFTVYEGRVPAEADLVCYWFVKAGEQMRAGRAKRVGLVSTNSIRGGANRRALQGAIRECPIFEAWSDEPWVVEGAAGRVSLVCFARQGQEDVPGLEEARKQGGAPGREGAPKQRRAPGQEGTPGPGRRPDLPAAGGSTNSTGRQKDASGPGRRPAHSAAGGSTDPAGRREDARGPEDTPGLQNEPGPERRLDGQPVDAIHADLTARRGGAGVDLTGAQRLYRNMGVAFMGDTKGGPFDVRGEQARDWLRAPANPNGRPNSDVLRPWMNGMDVTRRPADKWIVDFGWDMVREEAALYEAPYRHAREHVYPMRQRNRRDSYRATLVAARRAEAGHVAGARGALALHRDADGGEAPAVRLARRRHLPRPPTDRHCARRRHDLRHRAQPLPRGVVAAARHQPGRPTAVHPDHHLRDLPLPRRAVAPRPRRRVCGRPARRRHRGGCAAAGGAARALAEPARVGGVGGGAGPRLSEAPGRARRSGGEGAQGPHPHPPLQHPPAMAGRRPRGPRRGRRRSLRLAGGHHGRGGVAGASGAERRG